jgi:hypothetical protein
MSRFIHVTLWADYARHSRSLLSPLTNPCHDFLLASRGMPAVTLRFPATHTFDKHVSSILALTLTEISATGSTSCRAPRPARVLGQCNGAFFSTALVLMRSCVRVRHFPFLMNDNCCKLILAIYELVQVFGTGSSCAKQVTALIESTSKHVRWVCVFCGGERRSSG